MPCYVIGEILPRTFSALVYRLDIRAKSLAEFRYILCSKWGLRSVPESVHDFFGPFGLFSSEFADLAL